MAQASAEKLEHTGPAKKRKSGLSATERAVGKNKRGGSKREHGEEKVHSTVKESRFQEEKGKQARRASIREVEGSMIG